jgi:hypothetical protein
MRFRYVLPAVELLVSAALVWVPLWGYVPYYRGPDGKEIVCHDNCPPLPNFHRIDSVTFAKGINLPDAIVVFPMLMIIWDHSEHYPSAFLEGTGYSVFGIAVWFFVGRFVDDVVEWHRAKRRPNLRITDLVFFLAAALVATLAAVEVGKAYDRAGAWFIVTIGVWILIGYAGAVVSVLGLLQVRKERFKDGQ